jgi:hypothetical protein
MALSVEAKRSRRLDGYGVEHTLNCPWWDDWHRCDCGGLECPDRVVED